MRSNNGIAYLTEDRKTYGLVLINDVRSNITLANLGGVSNGGVISGPREITVANEYRDQLSIKTPSVRQMTVNLSGGNQQKVVLSKWLFANPDVLILDEPTRGIDVGAKYEIYTIINRLGSRGKGDHPHLVRAPGGARHHGPDLRHGIRADRRGDAGERGLAGDRS